jgi:hypothetical protein
MNDDRLFVGVSGGRAFPRRPQDKMEWSENTLGALEDGVKRSFDLLVIKATD